MITLSGLNHSQRPVGVPYFLVFFESVEPFAVPDRLLEHRVLATAHRFTKLLQRHLL